SNLLEGALRSKEAVLWGHCFFDAIGQKEEQIAGSQLDFGGRNIMTGWVDSERYSGPWKSAFDIASRIQNVPSGMSRAGIVERVASRVQPRHEQCDESLLPNILRQHTIGACQNLSHIFPPSR